MYQASHFQSATPLALSVIADTVLNPAFLPEEIESQREATRYEIREISAKPEMILPEILHQVAYGEGLGNPLLCPEDRIGSMDGGTLNSTDRSCLGMDNLHACQYASTHVCSFLMFNLFEELKVLQLSCHVLKSIM